MSEIKWLPIKLSELYKFVSEKKAERIHLVNRITRRHFKAISSKGAEKR